MSLSEWMPSRWRHAASDLVTKFSPSDVQATTSGSREFKIKYVCDGVYGPLSTVTVSTSVQEVQLRLVPVNVPVLTGSTALNSESASQVAASVRVLGANKAPLVGKFVKPVLVYSSGTAVNAQ